MVNSYFRCLHYNTLYPLTLLHFIIIVSVMIYLTFFFNSIQSSFPTHDDHQVKNDKDSHDICAMSFDHLPFVVWSHRAYVAGHVDGSATATALLLEAGIFNFDVDVSIAAPVKGTPSQFIIAHPMALTSTLNSDQLQSVSSFLDQVYVAAAHTMSTPSSLSTHVIPFVTLEPKFNTSYDLVRLLEEVDGTELGRQGHVAVIARTPQDLEAIQSYYRSYTHDGGARDIGAYKLRAIAVAFRSHRSFHDDYIWNLCPYVGTVKFLPRYISEEETVRDQSTMGPVLSIRQINMPDVKLLVSSVSTTCDRPVTPPRAVKFGGSGERPFERTLDSRGDPVVAWVVDTPDDLWQALAAGADAVISNKPIELRRALYDHYYAQCVGRKGRIAV